MDDHLLLGRLYRLNNDLQKAESEFKIAVKLQPDSEEAITTLAYLYNELGDTARAAQVLSSVPGAERSAKLVFGARLHLRAAEAIQRSHRGLSARD
jgi:thioredoxin-like negative regulator of GroEL